MEEIEAGDWKTRLKAYQNILQMMVNPSDELLSQLLSNLPNYIADIHPNCQRVALMICEKFFEVSPYINYPQISNVLINNCLGGKPQSTDLAISLILKCLHENRKEVLEQLFHGLENKSSQIILSVISIIVSHLATLTSQDTEEALSIIERLKPLLKNPDPKVSQESESAIAAAKIVAGSDLDTLTSSLPHEEKENGGNQNDIKEKIDDRHWIALVNSRNWKERKVGYEELLANIDQTSQFNVIEHNFVIPAGTEKNMLCEGAVVQIIEKLALTFKTSLFKKLQSYVNPLINIMSQKRQQSRVVMVQNAFDAIAMNVVQSPYEPPFVDFLLKMMTSPSPRLKEEALAFVMRCQVTPISQHVIDHIHTLASDPAQSVREAAVNVQKHKFQTIENEQRAGNEQINEKPLKTKTRMISPDVRRSNKRKQSAQSLKSAWENWIEPETLQLLSAGQWAMVTKGLDALQSQFEQDPSQPSAVVLGLSSMFMGKTFTPKVMVHLMQNLLLYMKTEPEKLTDEALTAAVNFSLDKIQDKRFEQPVFEILDSVAETNSAQFVFQILYPQLTVKNPIIPLRILTYFAHHLTEYESNAGVNIEELSTQIQPLFTHSDASVRKAANDCYAAIKSFDPDAAAEYFKYIKAKKEFKKPIAQSSESNNERSRIPKGRSEIPVPQRRPVSPGSRNKNDPDSARSNQHQERQPSPEKSFFPQRLVLAIAKTGSIIDTKKAIEEAISILNKQLENKGLSTVPSSEFTEFYSRARQWFKDANTNIVLSLTKAISLSFKVIIKEQIINVSQEFLCDVCLLLNIAHKGIRSAALNALSQLDSIHPSFVNTIFLPAFPKLNVEGRKAGVSFLKTLTFDMDVQTYYPLILNFLVDKSESFRESARPLIEKFLQLPNSMSVLKSATEQFTPAQKFQVLNRLNEFEKLNPPAHQEEEQAPIFICIPTQSDKEQREKILDPFLPLKVLNNEEKTDVLLEILQKYAEKYFPDAETIVSTETEAIEETCAMFLEIENNNPEQFSLILDIILLWWANQALLIKVQEGFDQIIQFLDILLEDLDKKHRNLSQFEFSIILPTVLECLGRDESQWDSIRQAIFKICDIEELMQTLSHLLSIASSVFTIVATFRTLMLVIPKIKDVSPYMNDLRKHTKKIQYIVSGDIQGNQELYDVTIQFLEFLKNYEPHKVDHHSKEHVSENLSISPQNNKNQNNTSSPKPNHDQNNEQENDETHEMEEEADQDYIVVQEQELESDDEDGFVEETVQLNSSLPNKAIETHEKEIEIHRVDYSQQVKVSTCELNSYINNQISSATIQVYRWIADLTSNDAHSSIQAMKSITAQMKEDSKVFEPHLEPLVISLISKVHSQFGASPLPVRLCKYVSFCLLTLFSETPLKDAISPNLIYQIIYELLTHLSNGISEPVLNQVLNAIIVKLMEDCQMMSFNGLLKAIGEFENIEHFSDKWLRLALKCFEACGVRLCEIGNKTDIVNAVFRVDDFFEEHPIEEIQESPLGSKIMRAIQSFISLVGKNFYDTISTPENLKMLANSPVLKFLEQSNEESF